jgi:transposase InsO family protein
MINKLHQFVHPEAGKTYTVRELCRLFAVNRAWYYARQKGLAQPPTAENELKSFVEKLLKDYAGYGVRRVTKALQKAGYAIGQHKVRRLLKKWGLAWQPLRKRKPQTTVRDPQAVGADNKLAPAKKQGQLGEPNRGWVGDVVYVSTRKESGYLATLLDVYSRKVVGWAVSSYNDTALTLKALQMAIVQRHPTAGLIHHSDHGSNYTSGQYRDQLAQIGAVVSHSRPGRPQENGIAESFNKTVSYEKLYLEDYQNLKEVEVGLEDWLGRVYNGGRLHSSLGYQSPAEFEQNWLAQKAQASGLVES